MLGNTRTPGVATMLTLTTLGGAVMLGLAGPTL